MVRILRIKEYMNVQCSVTRVAVRHTVNVQSIKNYRPEDQFITT